MPEASQALKEINRGDRIEGSFHRPQDRGTGEKPSDPAESRPVFRAGSRVFSGTQSKNEENSATFASRENFPVNHALFGVNSPPASGLLVE
jgi:hypothetical protein